MDILVHICLTLALFAVIRMGFEPDIMRKLLYLNVFGFAISATFVLLIPGILTFIATCIFYIGITLEANALASAYAVSGDS